VWYPYPKKLCDMTDSLVKECKKDNSECYILPKIDVDKLVITVEARFYVG
jgi:hypothetical protein